MSKTDLEVSEEKRRAEYSIALASSRITDNFFSLCFDCIEHGVGAEEAKAMFSQTWELAEQRLEDAVQQRREFMSKKDH